MRARWRTAASAARLKPASRPNEPNVSDGRDGEIRTRDPLNPIQVRYQAALRPVPGGIADVNSAIAGTVVPVA
jgi:hypothetical protein